MLKGGGAASVLLRCPGAGAIADTLDLKKMGFPAYDSKRAELAVVTPVMVCHSVALGIGLDPCRRASS